MFKFLSPDRPLKEDDANSKERKYDTRCGMSREEVEWRWANADRVSERMPRALDKLEIQLRRMRSHFLADPEALKTWDTYAEVVRHGFTNNLKHSLATPLYIPNSVLYEQLMKRKARSRTLVGMVSGGLDKLKQGATRNKRLVRAGTIAASVAAAFALGLAVGRTTQLHGEVSKDSAADG